MKHRLIGWYRYAKRFAAAFWLFNKNRMLGRSWVPHPRARLIVETVGFCNLECRFCSYPKKLHPRTVMDDALFRRSIDEAAALGYRHIGLTPVNGDVFMDKRFLDRLRYVDESAIATVDFYTNFIGADEATVRVLFGLSTLISMEISVYGHDPESFHAITRRGDVQYRRLVDNLTTLARLWPQKPPHLRIVVSLRTYRSFRFGGAYRSDLLDIVEELRRLGAVVGLSSTADNWGGVITHADLADIDMTLTDGRYLYKKGACTLPFDTVQIAADGRVNACACRDPRGSLNLGQLGAAPLADILSVENERWMAIVAGQEAGRFNEVCASCGFYQSIYDERRARYDGLGEMMTKDTYLSLFTAGQGK